MKRLLKYRNYTNFKRFDSVPALYYSSVSSHSSEIKIKRTIPNDNLKLKDFLIVGKNLNKPNVVAEEELLPPYLQNVELSGNGRKVFFDIYGCQMNVNDTEIVWSILKSNNYEKTDNLKEADIVLVMTCSIREGAESKIWNRLVHLKGLKKNRPKKSGPLQIGILGCMAERLKSQIVDKENDVDIVAGPDSYKDLPRLLGLAKYNISTINVLLSLDETYSDVMPVKLDSNSVTAYVSIMRGCDNMCSYCIVPFTRGRERSRPIDSIEREIRHLVENCNIKEVTLLGQNVNSYRDKSSKEDSKSSENVSSVSGFKTVYRDKVGGMQFNVLLERIANISPNLRIRFTSPHPKDFPAPVLDVIKKYPNICNSIHIPAQSGSSTVLDRMRRGYTRKIYLELIDTIRKTIPNCSLSSDFICGFCDETEAEFNETLTLIDRVKYNVAYMFPYSMREKTTAFRKFTDNVEHSVKIERLTRMVELFRKTAHDLNQKMIGTKQLILIEDTTKRSSNEMYGRSDGNIKVIIPRYFNNKTALPGDYIITEITDANSQVLKGQPLDKTNIEEFNRFIN